MIWDLMKLLWPTVMMPQLCDVFMEIAVIRNQDEALWILWIIELCVKHFKISLRGIKFLWWEVVVNKIGDYIYYFLKM